MGINIFESRTDKYDRNIYYKRQYVDNMKLFKGAVAQGVFYSTDKIPLQKNTIIMGSIKKTQYSITIVTTDSIDDLEVDDYVLYSDGNLYIVDGVIEEDYNQSKTFSNRPSFTREIRLRR